MTRILTSVWPSGFLREHMVLCTPPYRKANTSTLTIARVCCRSKDENWRGFGISSCFLLSALRVNMLGSQTWTHWQVCWMSCKALFFWIGTHLLCDGIRLTFWSLHCVYFHLNSQGHTKQNIWSLTRVNLFSTEKHMIVILFGIYKE